MNYGYCAGCKKSAYLPVDLYCAACEPELEADRATD